MAENNENFTPNKEEWIITYENVIKGYSFGTDLETAVAYLREIDPNNEVLNSLEAETAELYGVEDASMEQLKQAQALRTLKKAEQDYQTTGEVDTDFAKFNEVLEFLEQSDSEKVEEEVANFKSDYLERAKAVYAAENGIDETLSEDDVEANVQYIENVFDSLVDEVNTGSMRPEIEALRNIEVVDENDEPVSDNEHDSMVDALSEVAKEATVLQLSHNQEFSNADNEKRQEMIEEAYIENVGKRLLLSAAADIVGPRKKNESAGAYLRRYNSALKQLREENYLQKMQEAANGKPIVMRKPVIAVHTAMTEEALRQRSGFYKFAGMENLSTLFKKRALSFRKFAHQQLGNIHDLAVQMWRNKYQVGAMGVLSWTAVALTGSASLPVAAGVGAIYASISAISSLTFPLWNRRKLLLANAPKDVDTSHLKGFKNLYGLLEAFKSMDKEERRMYKNSQKIALGIAALSGVGMTVGAALTKWKLVQDAKTAAIIGGFARVGAVNSLRGYWVKKTGNMVEDMKAQLAENPQDEELAEKIAKYEKSLSLQKTALGLTVAATTVTAATQVLGGFHGSTTPDAHNPDAAPEVTASQSDAPVQDAPAQDTSTGAAAGAGTEAAAAAGVSEAQQYWENYQVPEMGSDALPSWKTIEHLGAHVSNEVKETIANRLHVDVHDLSTADIYDTFTRNLATFLHEHPDVAEKLGNPTPVELERDILQRLELSASADYAGKGIYVASLHDGEFHFADSNLNDSMNFWMKVLCNGYEQNVPEGMDLNKPFETLAADLAQAAQSGRHVRAIHDECGNVVYEGYAAKHPNTHPAQVVDQPAQVVEKPEPAQVVKEPEPAQVVKEPEPAQVVKEPEPTPAPKGPAEFPGNTTLESRDEVTTAVEDEVNRTTIRGTGANPESTQSSQPKHVNFVVQKNDGTVTTLQNYGNDGR